MNKNEKTVRKAQIMNCQICDKKVHYKYTRDEIIDLHHPKRPLIKLCTSDYCMEIIWLNYKLEDEIIPD